MTQHTHNWEYVSSRRGVHVTRECRCGLLRETTPGQVLVFDEQGRRIERRTPSIHEDDELNTELNARMPRPRGRATTRVGEQS